MKPYENADTNIIEEEYLKYKERMEKYASKIAWQYHCWQLQKDILSAGTIAFLERIRDFDDSRGAALFTFLHPYILAAMRREAQRNMTSFVLSKREFIQVCKERSLRQVKGLSINEAPDEFGYTLRDQIPIEQMPVQEEAFQNIYLSNMRVAFDSLSFKEREILGGFYGVFGYEKQTLPEIGGAFQMQDSAALKAKDKALAKLRKICMEGNMGLFSPANAAIWKVAQECGCNVLDISFEPQPHSLEEALVRQVKSYLECMWQWKLSSEEADRRIRNLALRVVVEQLREDNSKATLQAMTQLLQSGCDSLTALEQIAAVLLEEVYYLIKYRTVKYKHNFCLPRYVRRLSYLPDISKTGL